jgi:hypothetical protein
LTQEALDSFKVFEDVPADAASQEGSAGADGQAADGVAAGEDAVGGVAGDAAAAVDGQQGGPLSAEQLAQQQHHTRGTDYDEFGDAWKADLWKETQGG